LWFVFFVVFVADKKLRRLNRSSLNPPLKYLLSGVIGWKRGGAKVNACRPYNHHKHQKGGACS
jgi:hypothetical protein